MSKFKGQFRDCAEPSCRLSFQLRGLAHLVLMACFLLISCVDKKDTDFSSDGKNFWCDRKSLRVYLDTNDDGLYDNEPILGVIGSYQPDPNRPKSGAENYAYYSASAHPWYGPDPEGFSSHIFFFEGTDGLMLTFFSNVDSGGSQGNAVAWDITTRGNQCRDKVILADDSSTELFLDDVKCGGSDPQQIYRHRAGYGGNTDGGVIGPFEGKQFAIAVRVLQTHDLEDVAFYSAEGSVYHFERKNYVAWNKAPKFWSFILAYANEDEFCKR